MYRNQSSLTDAFLHPKLSERHLAYLEERSVSAETAKKARLSSLTKYQIEELLGKDAPPKSGGLGIPYLEHGEVSWRVRLDNPGNKKGRWRAPKGEPVRPYLPPEALIPANFWHGETAAPIYVSEGPIKALACTQAGFPCIGLGGVETGHDTNAWKKRIARLHPELLKRINWNRRVTILYDAGRVLNPRVALGEARIAAALKAAGAKVHVAAIPLDDGKDRGPDDFLAKEGKEVFVNIVDSALIADPLERVQWILHPKKTKESVREIWKYLEEYPFLAALHLGGDSLVSQVSWELKGQIAKKTISGRVAKFSALLWGKETAEASGSEEADKLVMELNTRHAVVFLGNKGTILWEKWDHERQRRRVEFIKEADLNLMYKNQRVQLGKREMSLASYWLRHPQRRQYKQVVFAPGQAVEGAYNLWKGFAIHPREGDWSLMQDHILRIVCKEDESVYNYVLAWMADALQNPGQRPGVVLCLRGKEGTGKGVFARQFGAIFGHHFLHVSNPRHLLGNFNAHLADCLLLYGDEAFWAGDKASEGALKALVTEPTLALERKGHDVIQVPNRVRLLLSSNNDWVVPAGLEARRFCVLDVSEERTQDVKYFSKLLAQMDSGGREAMMHGLMNFDLSKVNLNDVPQTEALLDQKILSLAPIQRFWYGRLEAGELVPNRDWKEWIPTRELHQEYIKEAGLAGDRRRSVEIQFGRELKKLCPGLEHKQVVVTIREPSSYGGFREIQSRVKCFRFPSLLDCRSMFEELIFTKIPWIEEYEEATEPLPF